jgi:hypothetical protein
MPQRFLIRGCETLDKFKKKKKEDEDDDHVPPQHTVSDAEKEAGKQIRDAIIARCSQRPDLAR